MLVRLRKSESNYKKQLCICIGLVLVFSCSDKASRTIYLYDDYGNTLVSIGMADSVRHGEKVSYYRDSKMYSLGIVESREHYENGFLQGTTSLYDTSGKLKERLNYNRGKLSGRRVWYYEGRDSIPEVESDYWNNEKYGLTVFYDTLGNKELINVYVRDTVIHVGRPSGEGLFWGDGLEFDTTIAVRQEGIEYFLNDSNTLKAGLPVEFLFPAAVYEGRILRQNTIILDDKGKTIFARELEAKDFGKNKIEVLFKRKGKYEVKVKGTLSDVVSGKKETFNFSFFCLVQ